MTPYSPLLRGSFRCRRRKAAVGFSLGVAFAFAVSPARADPDPPCTLAALGATPGFDARWQEALANLREQLRRLPPEECEAVSLSVEPARGGVRLVALADDGRRASRLVPRPSGLGPVALGLVASIPREERPSPPALAPFADAAPSLPAGALRPVATTPDVLQPLMLPPAVLVPPVVLAPERNVLQGTPAPEPPPPPSPLQPPAPRAPSAKEGSIGTSVGARYGAPTPILMADLEVRADLVTRGWLLTTGLQYAPAGGSFGSLRSETDSYRELAFGAGIGRHIRMGTSALDLSVGPSVVELIVQGSTPAPLGDRGSDPTFEPLADQHRDRRIPLSESPPSTSDPTEVRIGGSARWSVPIRPPWRFTVTLDGAGAFSTSSAPEHPAEAVPMLWTTGLRIGALGTLL
jgi:hypothetical protein